MNKRWYNLLGGSIQGGYIMSSFRAPKTTQEKAKALSFLYKGNIGMRTAALANWLTDADFVNQLYDKVSQGEVVDAGAVYHIAQNVYIAKNQDRKSYPDFNFYSKRRGLKEMERYLSIQSTVYGYSAPKSGLTIAGLTPPKQKVLASTPRSSYALAKQAVKASRAASKAARASLEGEVDQNVRLLLRASKGQSLMTKRPRNFGTMVTVGVPDFDPKQTEVCSVISVDLPKPTEV